ncbi:MAG: phosphotransferase [Chloroflexi bacterium]|nr:phosphotransferase [Chloroflexota bacterium]OJV92432.1 MAG: hypothetical protein BGO39_31410 [Chloroflexi bacterium 54-19]
MKTLKTLFEEYLKRNVDPAARLGKVELLPVGNQGFSGSVLVYYAVSYEDSRGQIKTVRLVTKNAPLTERRVLQRLSEQHLPGLALSHTLDLVTDKPLGRPSGAGQPPPPPPVLDLAADASMLICQQYLAGGTTDKPSPEFKSQAAVSLAAIHAANLGNQAELSWLPVTDAAFYNTFIVGKSLWPFWEGSLKVPEFVERFGHLTPVIEETEQRFLRFAQTLWEEGDSLTLVHADLHSGHVMADQGQPYFIDWGQAHYGSLYFDLPNYFSAQEALEYRVALARLGHEIPQKDFLERYHEAGRYVGFKYLSYCLWTWQNLEPKYDDSRLAIIEMVLNGTPLN